MHKLKKILGVITRLLLAVGADRWKQGQGIQIQSLAAAPLPPEPATLVSTDRLNAGPPVNTPGPALLQSTAPSVVVSATPPGYSFLASAKKILGQVLLIFWAILGTAAIHTLDAILAGGVLEKMHIPEYLPLPIIYAILTALRDRLRHPPSSGE